MGATSKDIAEFARLGLRFRILTLQSVVVWADHLIEESDVPETWVIDLAMADSNTVEDVLRHVPGESQAGVALQLFLALLHRRWRSGTLTIDTVRHIGWTLHCESALPIPERQADWGVKLEVECEEFDYGWRSEEQIRNSIDEKLAAYAKDERLLPLDMN